jgi:hypothetical protein
LVADRILALGVDHAGRHWGIELFNWPPARCNQREHRANGGMLHNRCEGFAKVDSRALTEVTDNPSSLVLVEGAIEVEFLFENPFARDDMSSWRLPNKSPCLIADESMILRLHSCEPIRITQCGSDGGWYW